MSNELLKIPATISKITTMADKTLRLHIDTQEITPQDASTLMLMNDILGVFVFSPADIKVEDLVDLPEVKVSKEEKSASEILRSRMFVYYTKGLKMDKSGFENWRNRELNRIGEKYLAKVNI